MQHTSLITCNPSLSCYPSFTWTYIFSMFLALMVMDDGWSRCQATLMDTLDIGTGPVGLPHLNGLDLKLHNRPFSVNDSFAKTPFQIPRLSQNSPFYARKNKTKNHSKSQAIPSSPILYQQKLQMTETPKPHYRQHQSQSQSNTLWRLPRCSFILSTRPNACPHSGHLTERCATCCTLIWRINDAWLLNVSRRVQPPQPHLKEPSDSLG